jgi:hypothetical protein
MRKIGTVDERFQSYNVEMVEVIGGRFWKPYRDIDALLKAQLRCIDTKTRTGADFPINALLGHCPMLAGCLWHGCIIEWRIKELLRS